ncbi:MAG: ferredoxin [Planctomycetaceae bacterium]|nr:ferredoxin [Planctomycetaceae bacterium]
MNHWTLVGHVADCPPGQSIECVAGDRIIALFNLDGTFHALDGICPHQGGPLAKGTLTNCIVTCPWHGWQFDVTTGQHQINTALKHDSLAVKVEGDEIFVALG